MLKRARKVALGTLAGWLAAAWALPVWADDVTSFFHAHCLRCHDAKEQKGEFRLDTLARDFGSEENAQRWAEVVFRMNSGEMPPKKEPQPAMRGGRSRAASRHAPATDEKQPVVWPKLFPSRRASLRRVGCSM